MKKKIGLIILAIISCLLIMMVIAITRRAGELREQNSRIAEFPDFYFERLYGGTFTSEEIARGPVVVVYYHPECEHCQYEVKDIIDNKSKFPGVKILLVSHAPEDQLISFLQDYRAGLPPDIIPLIDKNLVFRHLFGTDKVPSTFIYDSNLTLIKAFRGEVKSEAIIKILNEGS